MNIISEHITFEEATYSYLAKKEDIDNMPNEFQVLNMEKLAYRVFEPIRNHFNVPIAVSSFFRSEELNERLGGSSTSQHRAIDGAAMDLDADVYGVVSNLDIFYYIYNNLEFDQLILEDVKDEKAGWVHVSYNEYNNRKETLLMYRDKGKTKYSYYSENVLKKLMGK